MSKLLRTGSAGFASAAVLAAAAGLAVLASPANAHDEDWRKLADRLDAIPGPIYRLGVNPLTVAGTFDAVGVTCLSQVPLNNFAGFQNAGNDCWGYTSPSGREYAIMGLESGFGFVEITDPVNPQVIATIPGPTSIWHDVKVIGQYAYGVSEGGAGIQVMDLSQIDSGTVTLVRNQQSGGHSTTHNIVSNPESGSLWLVGANVGNGGLVGLNLSNPTAPTLQGGWTDMYVHDAQVVTWSEGPFAGREIAFCASGFDGGFTATGLRIVDVTNRSSPVVIGELFYPSAGYSHQVWLSDDRTTLYLNDELDEQNGQVPVTTTRVIDVTDLTSPRFVGTYTSGLPAVDHNLYTRDEFVFQANYRSGLRVFNASDPRNPVEIAYFDGFPNSDSAQFNGAWSSYPYFESGTVILSDIERGLFVLRVDAIEDERVRIRPVGDRPEALDPAGGQTVRALVEGINVSVDPASVRMIVTDAEGTETVAGTPVGGGVYEFAFPVVDCAAPVSYSFAADATTGQSGALPVNASVAPYTADVVSDVVVAIADDFESDLGWTVSGSITSANAGRWERGVPVGGGDARVSDPAFDADGSGSAYVTGNVAGNSDVDGGNTILTSPLFDGTEPGAVLRYSRWFDNNEAGAAGNAFTEVLRVQITNNNGSSWADLEVVGPTGPEVSGGWIEKSFDLASVLTPSTQMRVRFIATDNVGTVVEAGVDGFSVTSASCEDVVVNPCPADLAAPFGSLDFFDVLEYLSLFDANDPAADLAAPFGGLDFFDVLEYLSQFDEGCDGA